MRKLILNLSKPQKIGLAITVALIIAAIGVFAFVIPRSESQNGTKNETVKVTLGADDYTLETVEKPADLVKGLGGRSGLDDNRGMLFQYESEEQRCIWMKDMKFNIDVVWVNDDKRITSIVPNMSPASYPQSYCADARYVIELPAGAAADEQLRVGKIIELNVQHTHSTH